MCITSSSSSKNEKDKEVEISTFNGMSSKVYEHTPMTSALILIFKKR